MSSDTQNNSGESNSQLRWYTLLGLALVAAGVVFTADYFLTARDHPSPANNDPKQAQPSATSNTDGSNSSEINYDATSNALPPDFAPGRMIRLPSTGEFETILDVVGTWVKVNVEVSRFQDPSAVMSGKVRPDEAEKVVARREVWLDMTATQPVTWILVEEAEEPGEQLSPGTMPPIFRVGNMVAREEMYQHGHFFELTDVYGERWIKSMAHLSNMDGGNSFDQPQEDAWIDIYEGRILVWGVR